MKEGLNRRLPVLLLAVTVLITCLSIIPILFIPPPTSSSELGSGGPSYAQLTSGHWNDFYPIYNPNGQSIAFTSNRYGTQSLLSMNSDGSKVTSLFESSRAANVSQPVFDPSGRLIAFLVTWKNRTTSLFDVTADGRQLQQLVQDNGLIESFSWNPDGRTIAFDDFEQGSWTVRLVNVSNTLMKSISSPLAFPQVKSLNYRDPCWGPNGTWMVFSSDISGSENIWSYNFASGIMEQITKGVNDTNPSVSPNGKYIAFSRYANDESGWAVWIADSNGSNPHMATSYPPNQNPGVDWLSSVSSESNLAWSPDSNAVLFFSETQGGNSLVPIANVFVFYIGLNVSIYKHIGQNQVVEGDSLVPVVYGSKDVDPSWGNGGLSIAYSELGIDGHYHIWIRTFISIVPKAIYGR